MDKGARAERFYLLDSFYCFPFEKVPHGSKIIVYGAGYVGQLYEAQIRATQWCQIVCFVDKNWKSCEVGDIGVRSPQVILSDFDSLVVIAVASLAMGEEIKSSLLDQGVKKERIVYRVMAMQHHKAFRKIEVDSKTVDYFWTIRKLLQIVEIKDNTLVRVGGQNDGGYVMLNDFDTGGVAYSFGVGTNVSWDEGIAKHGYDVYMYDHTVARLSKDCHGFHFFRQGIAAVPCAGMDTLVHFLEVNGHEETRGIILKMDVEGAEWEVIDTCAISCLEKFDQIVMEIHGMLNFSHLDIVTRCLKKLSQTHYVVHVHANNATVSLWLNGKVCLSDCMEVTWANKKKYRADSLSKLVLPLPMDSPCVESEMELCLGDWNEYW